MQKQIMLDGTPFVYEHQVKKVKNLNLRVRADGTVLVSSPRFASEAAVKQFLLSHMEFIRRARTRMQQREVQREKSREEAKRLLHYGGKTYALSFRQGKRCLVLQDGQAYLSLPDPSDPDKCAAALAMCVKELFYPKLLVACQAREGWFLAKGVKKPSKICLRQMRTAWGNCRPKTGVLTFSTMAAVLPEDLLDHVVCHEYTHFLHPDHSPAFYAELAKLCPTYREQRHRLRQFVTY